MPIYFSWFITALLSVSGDADNHNLPQSGRLFILRGIRAMMGPSVINRNESEAGYLVVFRNANSAGIGGAPFRPCREICHGRGSPYKLNPRSTRKIPTAESPIARHSRFLCEGSKIRILPKA